MSKITLNRSTIETLPTGKYYDQTQLGLLLTVTATSKRYSFYGWMGGRPTKCAIGAWPEISVSEARTKAKEIWATPIVDKKDKVLTLGEVATRYSKRCATLNNRTDYMSMYFERHLTKYRDTLLDAIGTLELIDLHDEIAESSGPQSARRVVMYIRTLFSYAK